MVGDARLAFGFTLSPPSSVCRSDVVAPASTVLSARPTGQNRVHDRRVVGHHGYD
jgi:hypothetical protein